LLAVFEQGEPSGCEEVGQGLREGDEGLDVETTAVASKGPGQFHDSVLCRGGTIGGSEEHVVRQTRQPWGLSRACTRRQ